MEHNTARPVALVTGANKGIGYEIARQLVSEHGMTVLVGARDESRGRLAAEKLGATFVQLDVTNEESIRAAAERIEREHGHLDVLVNNAGIAQEFGGDADVPTLRSTFETNVFGPYAVTQAMLPLLRRSSHARIVNVSSGLGSLTQNSDPGWEHASVKPFGYNASKAALNMHTVIWAARLPGMKVNAADPGYTATDLNGNRGTQTVAQGAEAAVRLATLGPEGPTGSFFSKDGAVPW